jgi:hypothetical protein
VIHTLTYSQPYRAPKCVCVCICHMCIECIGVVSVVSQYMVYNCVYCCDTCNIQLTVHAPGVYVYVICRRMYRRRMSNE